MNTFLIILAVTAVANFLVGPAAAWIADDSSGRTETKAKMWVYLLAFGIATTYASGPMFA